MRATFNHSISGAAKAVATGHGRVYLGGSITRVDGYARNRVAAFDAVTGVLDQGWAPVADDNVLAILLAADRIFLGGRFSSVNGASGTQKLAAVTPDSGQVLTSFVSKVFAMMHDLALAGGTLYAGIDGSGGRAMAVDGLTGDAKWTITTDGDVQAIAVLEDVVYLGGHFDNVCKSANVGNKGVCLDGSTQRVKLAAVDLDGTLLPWTANGNGSVGVHTLIADAAHGQLSAGGEYSVINGIAATPLRPVQPAPLATRLGKLLDVVGVHNRLECSWHTRGDRRATLVSLDYRVSHSLATDHAGQPPHIEHIRTHQWQHHSFVICAGKQLNKPLPVVLAELRHNIQHRQGRYPCHVAVFSHDRHQLTRGDPLEPQMRQQRRGIEDDPNPHAACSLPRSARFRSARASRSRIAALPASVIARSPT